MKTGITVAPPGLLAGAVPTVVSLCRTRGLAVGALAEHGLETSTGTLPGRSQGPTVRGSAHRN